MAGKRGRPITHPSESPTTNRRRLETRERVRQLRLQRKQSATVPPQRSTEQLQQGEQIINLAIAQVEENEAAVFSQLAQLSNKYGESVPLTSSEEDTHLQQELQPVEDYAHNPPTSPHISQYQSEIYPHQTVNVLDAIGQSYEHNKHSNRSEQDDCHTRSGGLTGPTWSMPSNYRSSATNISIYSPSILSSASGVGHQLNAPSETRWLPWAAEQNTRNIDPAAKLVSSPAITVDRRKRARPPSKEMTDARTMRRRQVALLRQRR